MKNLLIIRRLIRKFIQLLFFLTIWLIILLSVKFLEDLFHPFFDTFIVIKIIIVVLMGSVLLIISFLAIQFIFRDTDIKLILGRYYFRRHIIISVLGVLVVLYQLLSEPTYAIANLFFSDRIFSDLSLVLMYQSLLWLNITYIMVSKTIMLVPNYRKLNLELVKVAALFGILMFIIINPIVIKNFNNSIQIMISLSNIILMSFVLIYDYRLTEWFKNKLRTEIDERDGLKPDLLLKYFLYRFFVDDYFPYYYLNYYKPSIGDCCLLLTNFEIFAIDSYHKILFNEEKFYEKSVEYQNEMYFVSSYY